MSSDTLTNEDKLRDYLKRATVDLRAARAKLREYEDRTSEPVAIVGMGCRFPGGIENASDLWAAVEEERDLVGPFPTDRGWDVDALYDPSGQTSRTTYVAEGAFLDGVGVFDAEFFGISPREALSMDPQQRLLLEVTWSAIEDARIDPRSLRGSQTGVYLGATDHDYGRDLTQVPEEIEGNVMIGRSGAVSSGRLAYVLGLHGPAVTMDTMCSSSLVALHMACAALRRGECQLALTGGTTVMSTPEGFLEFSKQNALARDGRCKAFSENADGTGWAEGIGVLVLERLSDALRNGRRIHAVVRGSAINQDGASNGLTAPNGTAQRQVIQMALADAGILASEVDHVEAHGTGTRLGDPIEAGALAATYGRTHSAESPLWLGSLKSNLGHAASAAGVAGVIKTVMSLKAERMGRTLHAEDPMSSIDWTGGIRLLQQARPWPRGERPRRGAVSAFGASGTNAHAIIEEAPQPATPETSEREENEGEREGTEVTAAAFLPDGPWLWQVSAATPDALGAQARRLREHVCRTGDRPADIARSLATTRARLQHSAAVVGADADTLIAGLDALGHGREAENVVTGEVRKRARGPVFVFPGQGAQWIGMGRELAQSCPAFANRLRECSEAVARHSDIDVLGLLQDDDPAWMDQVEIVQPVLWAMMVALAGAWEAAGVRPAAVVGHSQGEIAAACVAGLLGLEDAAKVVVARSAAIARCKVEGAMLSVSLSEEELREYVPVDTADLSLAAVNGAHSVVVAGDVEGLMRTLDEKGVRNRRIAVAYASHSPRVEPLRDELVEELRDVSGTTGRVPMVSTVVRRTADPSDLDAEYWYSNLREPVHLDAVVRQLAEQGHDTFVEVSPHPLLVGSIEDSLVEAGIEAPLVVGTLARGRGGAAVLLGQVGALLSAGVDIAFGPLFEDGDAQVVDLPTYAFHGRWFWVEDPAGDEPARSAPTDAQSRFWDAIDAGDVDALVDVLGDSERDHIEGLLPALRVWRRHEQEDAVIESWRYGVRWEHVDPAGTPSLSGRWLVFAPRSGEQTEEFVSVVTQTLGEYGADVARFDIDTASSTRDDLRARLAQTVQDGTPSGVVSLLSHATEDLADAPGVPSGLAADLHLLQALADEDVQARVWLVTRGGVRTDQGDPAPRPDAGAAWALGRVAALEFPDRWGGLVDLPTAVGFDERHRLAAVLGGLAGDEDQIAIRRRGHVARRLYRPRHKDHLRRSAWHTPACALLVGGTGGIGGRIAMWLAHRGTKRIILTGRRGPDTPGIDDLLSRLREVGADAVVESLEAGDQEGLARIRDRERANGTPITAAFHIAGAGNLAPITEVGPDSLRDTVVAKIAGGRAFDAVFTDPDTDVVLFSSISAAWGSGEHGAYAAANGYLDALAENRVARGLPAQSLVWGIWDPQEDGGMAADLAEEQLKARGVPFMDPTRALDALDTVLGSGHPVEVIASVDWKAFVPVFTSARPAPLLTGVPEAAELLRRDEHADVRNSDQGLADRLAAMAPAARTTTMVDLVREQVAASLRFGSGSEIRRDRRFRDMGFDSLTSVDLRNRLSAVTGLRLPATLAFDHPDVNALSATLLEQLCPQDGTADAAGSLDAPADPLAAQIRAAVAAVPIERLREAGLVDPLLDLAAGGDGTDTGPRDRETATPDSIDDLDTDGLIELALGKSDDGQEREQNA